MKRPVGTIALSALLAAVHGGLIAVVLSAPSCAGAAQTASAAQPEPMLEGLIRTSLVSSPALWAKRGDVSAARSDIDAARWQYAPAFSADVQQGSGPSVLNDRVLRLDQKIYAGGRLDAELHGANSRRDSAVYAVRESALALALQIVNNYQALATADSQLTAIGAYRTRLDALDGTITRRIESGVSAAADRSLMSARLAQSLNDLASVRATQRNAVVNLEKLVGDVPAVNLARPIVAIGADTQLAAVCRDDAAADAALRDALAQHPALQRMERDIDAARASVDVQRSLTRPTVGVRVEQPVAPGIDSTLRSTRVSLVMQYVPDAGLSSLARADAASARVASLVYQADALQRDVVQQIRSECAEQAAVVQRVAGFALARGYTTDVLESSTRLFIAGKRGWFDLLNAAREDFDNEQSGIAANAALLGSRYRLALLTGALPLALPGPADEPPSNLATSMKALLR